MSAAAHPFSSPPKIVMGLDLDTRCAGALAWLAALTRGTGQSVDLRAVHALSTWRSQFLASVLGEDKVQARVQARLTQFCEEHAQGLVQDIEFIQDKEISEGLQFFAAREHADLLVLGRVAPRDPTPFVRLGSVTRAVLQSLMLPALVVPSDYELGDFGPGPVMIAVDGTDTSNAALEFGQRWAAYLGRDYFLAHVLPSESFLGQDWLAPDELKQAQDLLRQEGQSEIDRWLRDQGQTHARLELAQGSNTFHELRYLSIHHEACMVVTGSRCLNAGERLFSTSMSSALAAGSDRPVAVVPSTPWLDHPDHRG